MSAPVFRPGPVSVRVPATSANLGPAFDSAGLCLALHDDVTARVTDTGLSVEVEGEGAGDLPRSERHLVVRAMREAFTLLGGQPAGLELRCVNRVPQARGLGSSSAAIVGGLLAARGLVAGGEELLGDAAVLRLATEVEGHPDNVAACLRGGVTFSWTDGGEVGVARAEPHPDLTPVVFVPADRSSTKKVRGMLPAAVPHADAAANAGRSALLALALTAQPELLLPATRDLLHQGYRAPAMPHTAALVEELRARGVAAAVSGAGPTVLALATTATVDEVAVPAPGWTVLRPAVDREGARLVPAAG